MAQTLSTRSVLIVLAVTGLAGTLGAQTKLKKVPIEPSSAVSGADMFYSYCASCHGTDGKGNGPASVAMAKPLPDLTKLATHHGGEFPALSVMMTLGRMKGTTGHGSEQMPVWGDLFRRSTWGEDQTQLRVYNMTRFLESIQDPPSTKDMGRKPQPIRTVTDIRASAGSAMYSGLCSSCHGEQGLGDGPAAKSLKAKPADLTTIASRNRGEFPAARLEQILDRNPGSPAHGSTEMPIWGNTFRATGENPSFVSLRIHNLVGYLRSLQR